MKKILKLIIIIILLLLLINLYVIFSTNGKIVSFKTVDKINEKDLMIMTNSGIIIRLPLEQVSILKRATQGVRLIHLKDKQVVATIAIVEKEKEGFKSSRARRLGIKIISFFIKLKTKTKLYDVTSGYRAIDLNLIKQFL